MPTREWFCLMSRVPVKYLSGEKLEFALVPKEKAMTVVPVASDKPFTALDKLESAHLQESNDKAEIVIDPNLDQQDSGQSQESPHRWEQP